MTFSNPAGDPRERFPDLAHLFTDQVLGDWKINGLCLCGCGVQTKYVKHSTNLINYFAQGHAQRLKRQHGLAKGSPRTQKVRNATRRKNLENCIDARYIMSAVREAIDSQYGGSLTAFARAHDLPHSTLSINLRNGTKVTKARARQLLIALGETPHHTLA